MSYRQSRLVPILVGVAALAAILIVAVPSVREPILRNAGWALVVDEPVTPADIIVITADSYGAGALEAADLVQSGIATRVAVFAAPPTGDDREFIRRGLPYEDGAARQIRQLRSLGVTDVLQIPVTEAGTEAENQMLPAWCDRHQFRSIVLWLLGTTREDCGEFSIGPMVRAARYSIFDPDRWWETRDGVRTEIIEFQKLILEMVLHPLSF
jgi:hypothetical protein